MITFDSLTLKAFIKEQKDFFINSRINKIQQPTRREFIFSLRNNSLNRSFYININPQNFHVCFASKENLEKRYVEIPQKPPMFCMLLRKYLGNSKIIKINQPDYERILELYFETYNELGDKIYLCLAIELMGKYSNVILYNCDTGIIIGCAHNVGQEKSRQREVYGSIPYIYPQKQIKTDILNYEGEIDWNTVSETFYNFSSAFARQCRGKSLDDLKNYVSLKNLSPAVSNDFSQFCLFSQLLDNPILFPDVNSMIDSYFTFHTEKEKFNILKSHYLAIVNKKIKKLEKSINLMKTQLSNNSDYSKYRRFGDLIMANLYNLKDYSSHAAVYDWESEKQVDIALDDTLTLKDNANKFYKLYNKAKTSNEKLSALVDEAVLQKDYQQRILYSINLSENIAELRLICDEVEDVKIPKAAKVVSEPLKIELDNETVIYIGKNNKQNDYIVSKLAADEDLWFHTKDCAGSHVLLKTQKVTDELILKCANYAKTYSSAKDSSKIGVIYTKRKYLKKPPKSNLGYVTYRNETEIIID